MLSSVAGLTADDRTAMHFTFLQCQMMARCHVILFCFIICSYCVSSLMLPPTPRPTPPIQPIACEYYEYLDCTTPPCNSSTVTCEVDIEGKRPHCYALWMNKSGSVELLKKGCWFNTFDCNDPSLCVSRSTEQHQFCCCENNFCNVNMYSSPFSVPHSQPTTTINGFIVQSEMDNKWKIIKTGAISLLSLTFIAVVILLVFWLWRRRKFMHLQHLPPCDPPPPAIIVDPTTSPSIGPLLLLEIKAQGRFGCVWKARTGNGAIVAVKVFPLHDRQSWATERDFYVQPRLSMHENLLRFFGADRRDSELWLVTEYHDRGSLYDYLKCDVVTLDDLIVVALTMCRGLAFLHESDAMKSAVAHRDFKSRNVLLRSDFTACIADFGLALVLHENPGDIHCQVGTRRYMSPEVLDGSINFTVEHFLKIDIYACALVLWELLSRCVTSDELPGEYRMPFEAEVGLHPTLEDMQDVVVNHKQRPELKDQWLKNEDLSMICSTIEECWDQDPEARLSAKCTEMRFAMLYSSLSESKVSISTSQASSTDAKEDTSLVV